MRWIIYKKPAKVQIIRKVEIIKDAITESLKTKNRRLYPTVSTLHY